MARPRSKGDAGKFQWSPDSAKVQSLGGGTYVRIFDHNGKGRHVPATPGAIDPVLADITDNDPALADRVVAELSVLGISGPWAEPPSASDAP